MATLLAAAAQQVQLISLSGATRIVDGALTL